MRDPVVDDLLRRVRQLEAKLQVAGPAGADGAAGPAGAIGPAGDGYWDAISTHLVQSTTNVSVELARWTIPAGEIWNVYALTMGKGTSAAYNSFSQDGWAIAYRNGGAAGLLTGVGGLTGGSTSVTFTVAGNDLILSVVGAVGEPVTNWRSVVRRLVR